MPTLPASLHTALRDAVAHRFGHSLRYPSHCDALEAELQKAPGTGGRRLSPSTLRRFFGLVDKQGGYHLHTLDTLARYAGHADFADFGRAVAGLAQTSTDTQPPTDIPELLAMERLAAPERLLLGYFLGRVTRPGTPAGPAAPLALRLATHPAGQEFFVESFVDLAYLNGAYGEVLVHYLQHKRTNEAQLFGHSTLFLGEFLAEDEAAWRRRLVLLLALPVPADTHAFPRGRLAFAEIMAAWSTDPGQPLPADLVAYLWQQAAAVPRAAVQPAALPAFYNLFPAGYHFLVAEALFLTTQFDLLEQWLALTAQHFPELATLEHNVYNELLRAFRAVSGLYAQPGRPAPAYVPAVLHPGESSWLMDYYQVHSWLVQLHFAVRSDLLEAGRLLALIEQFAAFHKMPFFGRVARQVVQSGQPG